MTPDRDRPGSEPNTLARRRLAELTRAPRIAAISSGVVALAALIINLFLLERFSGMLWVAQWHPQR